MRRITTATRAVDLFGAGKDGFKNGNLALGVSPTDFNADWPNQIQEEIANFIEAAGLTLNGADFTQLLQAFHLLAAGRLLNVRQILTTQVYTPTAGTKAVLVLLQAPGGGGGGTTATGAGQVAAGLGGGGGSWGLIYLTSGFSGVTVTIGAAGTGVNGGQGNTGGTSSFGGFLSCPGGNGGQVSGAQSPPTISGGGATSGAPSVSGTTLLAGSGGGFGLPAAYIGTGAFYSGAGGHSFLGEGGALTGTTTIGGNPGRGYGAGGSGSSAVQSTAGTTGGGSGAPSVCLVLEFGG